MASPTIDASTPTPSDWTAYAPLDAKLAEQLRAASGDVVEGFRRHRSWRYLAAETVRNQYRRTVLGPWWLTIQTAVYVLGLAVIFGQLQGRDLKDFLPFVLVGYMTFSLLSGMTRNGSNLFVSQAGKIQNNRQPLSSLVLRSVTTETIQFGHTAVIVLGLFAVRMIDPSLWLLLVPPAFLLCLVNGVALAFWLGPLTARFRDVAPAVESVLQVMIFFTPIFYRARDLGSAQFLVQLNPFTHLIVLLRDGVLGLQPELITVIGVSATTGANVLLAVVVFARSRSRLPYWVA